MPQDSELLASYALTRDASAFNDLVTRYADLVYGTCLRVTGNVEDARDASQDCFLTLARGNGHFSVLLATPDRSKLSGSSARGRGLLNGC